MPNFAYLENDIVVRIITASASPGGAGWQACDETTCRGQIWDGAAFADAPRHPSHAEALEAARASLRASSEGLLSDATEHASAIEMATWPPKLTAALDWDGGSASADTHALLDAVGGPRGLDRAGAAQLILTKAGLFQAAANGLEAIRVAGFAALDAVDQAQPLADYIAALDAAVAGVDWSLGS